jgi:hypothetical protein
LDIEYFCSGSPVKAPAGFAGTYGFDMNGGNISGSHASANGEIQLDSQGHVLGGFVSCNFKPDYFDLEAYSQITNGCYCFYGPHSGFITFDTVDDGFCGTDDRGADMDFTVTPSKLHLTIDGSDENFDEGDFLTMGGSGEHE